MRITLVQALFGHYGIAHGDVIGIRIDKHQLILLNVASIHHAVLISVKDINFAVLRRAIRNMSRPFG